MGYKKTHICDAKQRVDAGESVERKKGQGWPRKFVVPSVSSGPQANNQITAKEGPYAISR